MDGGAWWAAVHGVIKSWTWVSHFTFTFHFHALEKEMATHSSVLAWRIPGMGEPGGLPSMGSHRVGHNWSDLAAAAAVSRAKLPVFVLGVLILLVHVPYSMRGVSSPCSRNLTNANIFWDHDNITGITPIEIFLDLSDVSCSKDLSQFIKDVLEDQNVVTGDSLWNMSGSVINSWKPWDISITGIQILKMDQCSTWRTDRINYKVLHQRDTAKKRDFHKFLFSCLLFSKQALPDCFCFVKAYQSLQFFLGVWWSVWCVKWAKLQSPVIQTNINIGVAMKVFCTYDLSVISWL